MIVRVAAVCGLAFTLLSPSAGYRVNVKKVVDMKMSKTARRGNASEDEETLFNSDGTAKAEDEETLVNSYEAAKAETEANATTLTQFNSSASVQAEASAGLAQDPAILVEVKATEQGAGLLEAAGSTEAMELDDFGTYFMKGERHKRTVGNLLATAGLMRARFVLGVASSALPESFFQHAQAAPHREPEIPTGPKRPPTNVLKKFIFATVILAVTYLAMERLLAYATTRRVGFQIERVKSEELQEVLFNTLKIWAPQVATLSLLIANEVVSTICMGHVGTLEQLASVGLNNMVMSAVVLPFAFGILAPADALISAAWSSGDKDLVVSILSRIRFIGAMQVLWLAPIAAYAYEIFMQIGQDPTVAFFCAQWFRMLVFLWIPIFFNQTTSIVLKNINDPLVGSIGLFMGNLAYLCMCFYFVVHAGLGPGGVGLSFLVQTIVSKAFNDWYLCFRSDLRDAGCLRLFLFDPRIIGDMRPYIEMAVPAAMGQCAESWFWEIVTLMVGSMGAAPLAAHVLNHNVQTLCLIPAYALSSAAATMTGHLLGAGKKNLLNAVLLLFPGISVCIWTIVFIILMFCRGAIAVEYDPENQEVQALQVGILGFIAVAGYGGALHFVASGCLQGMGRQWLSSSIVMVANYLVAIPLAYLIGIRWEFGVYGIYVGWSIGVFVRAITMVVALMNINPALEVDLARQRIQNEHKYVTPHPADQSDGDESTTCSISSFSGRGRSKSF